MISPRFLPPRGVLLALGICAVLGTSCSKSLQSVSGKVLHKGAPIQGAVVTLHPKGNIDDVKAQRPSGVTDENGVFTLSTGKETGAAPGEYVVTILWLKEPAAPAGKKVFNTEGAPDAVDQFQGRYADSKTSKITVTIKSGVSELEPIKLD